VPRIGVVTEATQFLTGCEGGKVSQVWRVSDLLFQTIIFPGGEMKKISAVILLVLLLTACQTTTPAPTATNLPAPTATLMQLPISTPTEKETPVLSPSPTAVPPTVVLDYFPLSAGAIWKYSAEISYEDPNNSTQLATWSGLITDEVIDQITTPDGRVIFRLQEELEPIPPKEVWRQSSTLE
jgi:hypothetical protein